ncbi:hypothetical protein NCS57_00496900 [Fusarium keratoplasticum]|uniref:Uncharacterized protein n=1 Tax=Fusarium keratoplasticum TaxID=1328300 RepID=A0ACC0R6G2_9HYPO|nr:hypothetical protein NCS57_00496900 [Fusarium keratoplasticum]KAI8675940.1 hypothetical protein NCS57_00496900 [Fusarium keratoplasticum]
MPLPHAQSDEGPHLHAVGPRSSLKQYQCAVPGCRRAYRRNEHLLRHMRSHDSQKPYECPKCHKCYSRQDVLKRHVAQQHETLQRQADSSGQKGNPDSPQPYLVALSPSTTQNEASVGWQRDEDEARDARESSSLHSSIRDLRSQSQVSTSQGISDAAHEPGPHPAMLSPGTALQLVLDSCDPWIAQPATPDSSLMTGYHTTRPDAPEAIESDSSRLPSIARSSGPVELQAPQTSVLRNGILEELDALEAPDFSVRHPLGNLGYRGKEPFEADQPQSIPMPFAEDFAARPWLDYYFERFHPRWPIIHQSTFDPAAAIPDLVSMMSMIGAWEYGVTPSLEVSERWSESLVLRLSNVLSQVSTWPTTVSESAIQAYQALLLNVIFTLEYLDDMRFKKAYPRYCMMIAIFRGANLFQEQQILVQDETQDMIPTSWLIREKFKRLAFYTFRLDNYFYFLQGHYPVLRYEELCLATPCSERLWEATTVEEWHDIKEIESKKRAAMLFMTLMDTAMDCEGRDTLPPLLEDDFVYGICAMQTWLWRDIKRHRPRLQVLQSSEGPGIISAPASSRPIEYWSAMLTTWSECLRDRSIGSPLSSEKHRELLENCTPALYHFSQMSLRANLEAIQDLAMDRYRKQYSGPYRRQLESRILEWVRTSDARLALWHAAQVLKLLQETSDSMETRGSSLTSWRIDFIAPLALYKAGLIVWAYARSIQTPARRGVS